MDRVEDIAHALQVNKDKRRAKQKYYTTACIAYINVYIALGGKYFTYYEMK